MATTVKTEIQPDVSKMPDYVRDDLCAAVMDLFWSCQNADE